MGWKTVLRIGRQDNGERRALAHFRFDLNSAFVVLDNLLADRQAQAGAFGFSFARGAFGGEEGLENAGQELVGDSRAVVDDLDENFRVSRIAEALDGERAAAAQHGLAGVNQQIEQYLLELHGVPKNGETGLDLDAQSDAILL